jgi:hypothetical protein
VLIVEEIVEETKDRVLALGSQARVPTYMQ